MRDEQTASVMILDLSPNSSDKSKIIKPATVLTSGASSAAQEGAAVTADRLPFQRASLEGEQSRAGRWRQVVATAELGIRDRWSALAGPVVSRSLASRSLSMLTWSVSILVSTLRATASRSAMSADASE